MTHVVMDEMGIYGLDVALALDAAEGLEVMVANPLSVHAFANAMKTHHKTDPVDEEVLVQPTFLRPGTALPMVSTLDIGRTAAANAIGRPRPPVVELSGPAGVTTGEVAEALAALLDRPVTPQFAPLEAIEPAFTSMGVSEDAARLYRAFYEGLLGGRVTPEHPHQVVRGQVALREGLARLL